MQFTLPETNIAHENPIFPGKYTMIFHGYVSLQECRGWNSHFILGLLHGRGHLREFQGELRTVIPECHCKFNVFRFDDYINSATFLFIRNQLHVFLSRNLRSFPISSLCQRHWSVWIRAIHAMDPSRDQGDWRMTISWIRCWKTPSEVDGCFDDVGRSVGHMFKEWKWKGVKRHVLKIRIAMYDWSFKISTKMFDFRRNKNVKD